MIHYTDFPKAIEIQTATFCNGRCTICPHHDLSGQKPAGVMSVGLFKKIIDQVGRGWGIRIIPYLNNEPFLDPFFIKRLEYIVDKCPDCEIEIATNASLLDRKMQDRMSGIIIRDLRLSVFGFSKNGYERIMTGLSWKRTKANLDSMVKNKKFRKDIGQISLVMIDYPGLSSADVKGARKYCLDNFLKFELWGFLDRAGSVGRYRNGVHREKIAGCEQCRPLERMHIGYAGKVILCSMDWKEEVILGNLNENSVREIWHSRGYNLIRKNIYSSGPPPVICAKCKLAEPVRK
ncbi:MAG: radical SAM/SPASM domain-containing protein [Candidatus Falkowbacteria bacterium]